MANTAATEKISDPVAYNVGIVYASVCVPWHWEKEQVEEWMNGISPTGISSSWVVCKEDFRSGEPNPCPCDTETTTKRHWLLNC